MMYKKLEKLSYENKNENTPDSIFIEMGNQLEKETDGNIKGVIEKYEGKIESYIKKNDNVFNLAKKFGINEELVDVQDSLGQIEEKKYKYEFFLAIPKVSNFKFRLLFFEFGSFCYPVRIILERKIADELYDDGKYEFSLNSENELRSFIVNVIDSNRVFDLIQEIINSYNAIAKLEEAFASERYGI